MKFTIVRSLIGRALSLMGAVLLCMNDNAGAVVISHWDFEEGSGITAADSAVGNTGTLLGGPSWTNVTGDGSGTALHFDGTFGDASGLMWIRDWEHAYSISAAYQFNYLPEGRIEWRMSISGSGNQFRLYNGRPDEEGLMVLGIQLVESDTVRIVSDLMATQDQVFLGTNFSELHTWRWDWVCDPDGVNGVANLSFQRSDGVWETVFSDRPFDANVVPDAFWLQSVGDLAQNKYIALDSLTISVLPPLNNVAGDLNQDGVLNETDISLFVAG